MQLKWTNIEQRLQVMYPKASKLQKRHFKTVFTDGCTNTASSASVAAFSILLSKLNIWRLFLHFIIKTENKSDTYLKDII